MNNLSQLVVIILGFFSTALPTEEAPLLPTTYSTENTEKLPKSECTFSDTEQIYVLVDQMPLFSNCGEKQTAKEKKSCSSLALYKFISKNITYPKTNVSYNDKVIVRLIIDKKGNIKCPKVSNGFPALDVEVLKLIDKMPRWTPGRRHNKPVNVIYNIPIRYKF